MSACQGLFLFVWHDKALLSSAISHAQAMSKAVTRARTVGCQLQADSGRTPACGKTPASFTVYVYAKLCRACFMIQSSNHQSSHQILYGAGQSAPNGLCGQNSCLSRPHPFCLQCLVQLTDLITMWLLHELHHV